MAASSLYFLRPKVVLQEIDGTKLAAVPAGTTAFVNGEFRRGSLTPQFISGSTDRLYANYGEYSDPTLSFAHDTSVAYLSSKGQLLINRVVPSDATHGLLDVVLDVDATYGPRMLFLPSINGMTAGYEGGSQGVHLLKVSAPFVTGNTFSMTISDGTVAGLVTTPFAVSHTQTMANIATAITTALAAYGTGGYAEVYVEPSSVLATAYTIAIHSPVDATIVLTSPTITGGATQAVPTIIDASDCWFASVFAENPGAWSKDVGIKINQVDEGQRERYRLTFNQALVTGNAFNVTINGVAATATNFNTNNDQTMADIAAALTAHPNVREAFVEETIGSVHNDRTIIVVAELPGPDYLTISSPVVTGGATQALVTASRTLTGKNSSGTMVLEVFKRTQPTLPIERYSFSTFPYRNGRGEQAQYTTTVNGGSKASKNVRLVVNPALLTEAGFATILPTLLRQDYAARTTIAYMGGGQDGSSVLTSQMISALSKFEDRIHYPVNMLLNAGYTAVAYQKALVNLAELRGDCTAILDMPSTKQEVNAAREYRLYELDIDSSFGTIYTPDHLITDISTGEERFIPPSGCVAAAYVYNDTVGARWSAPAGYKRGRLRTVMGFRVTYSPLDEELLHPIGVNCCVDRPLIGPVIMGEQTLQRENSALSSVHIRRLMNMLETQLVDGLDYSLFDPHTESTRFEVYQLADGILSPIHRREGLYDYFIQCDENNNTADVIDADALALDVYVKPVRAIKGILARAIITRTGVSFQTMVATINGTTAV